MQREGRYRPDLTILCVSSRINPTQYPAFTKNHLLYTGRWMVAIDTILECLLMVLRV